MLNKNGQIAPDAAVFQDGKQNAPIVKLKVGDHHEIQVPLYVQPGLADYTLFQLSDRVVHGLEEWVRELDLIHAP